VTHYRRRAVGELPDDLRVADDLDGFACGDVEAERTVDGY